MGSFCTTLEGCEWQDVLAEHLSPAEKARLRGVPRQKLLSGVVLMHAAKAKRRYKELLQLALPIRPEIDADGKRRCIFVEDNGERCCTYSSHGLCRNHMAHAASFSKHFKSQRLKDQYSALMSDPRRMQLTGEQAMLRLLLTQLLEKFDGDAIPMHIIEAGTVLCKEIAAMTTTISKLNQLTPEAVDAVLAKVVDIMADYVPPEKLEEAAKRVQALTMIDPMPVEPVLPGNLIEINGENVKIESTAVDRGAHMRAHMRALNDTIQRMELE